MRRVKMKKNEPLKGKIHYLDTRYPMSLSKFPLSVESEIEIFFMDDVKSAVQGLMQEIKREKERYKEIKEVIY